MIYIKHCFWQNSTFLDEFMAMVLKATLIYPKSLSRFYINCSIIVWKKQIIIQQFRWHTLLLCVKNVADVQNVLSIPTFISFFNLDKTMEICQKTTSNVSLSRNDQKIVVSQPQGNVSGCCCNWHVAGQSLLSRKKKKQQRDYF